MFFCSDLATRIPSDSWRGIWVHLELNSVQIQSAVTDRSTHADPFLAAGRKKFNLNLRSQGQIGEREQSHPNIAEIDAESVDAARSRKNLHRGVQQLPLPATPVWFGIEFENHRLCRKGQGSAALLK